MSATVTPLRVCSCGQPGAPLTVTCVSDDEILHAYICDDCLAKVEARLASVRPVFNAMMECAVPKPIADEAMRYLLDMLDEDEEGGDEISGDNDNGDGPLDQGA